MTHVHVVDDDIGYARILEVLAQAADRNAVAAVASSVLHADIVGAGFDGYAVVAALVDEVCEEDILRVHSICLRHQRQVQPFKIDGSTARKCCIPKPSVFCTQLTP